MLLCLSVRCRVELEFGCGIRGGTEIFDRDTRWIGSRFGQLTGLGRLGIGRKIGGDVSGRCVRGQFDFQCRGKLLCQRVVLGMDQRPVEHLITAKDSQERNRLPHLDGTLPLFQIADRAA